MLIPLWLRHVWPWARRPQAALPRQALPEPMLTTLQCEELDHLIDALEAEVTEQIRRVRLFAEAFGETTQTAKIEYVLTCVQDDLRRIGREHDNDDE